MVFQISRQLGAYLLADQPMNNNTHLPFVGLCTQTAIQSSNKTIATPPRVSKTRNLRLLTNVSNQDTICCPTKSAVSLALLPSLVLITRNVSFVKSVKKTDKRQANHVEYGSKQEAGSTTGIEPQREDKFRIVYNAVLCKQKQSNFAHGLIETSRSDHVH